MAALTKTASTHQTIQQQNQEFLAYAASNPNPTILGSIASGSSGGSGSPVVWADSVPTVDSWIESIYIYASLPYTITVPSAATCYVSPFAPWSVLMNKFTIAGSPPWDDISFTPFYLDEITRRRNWDPASPGVPIIRHGTTTPSFTDYQDLGTWEFDPGNSNLIPGAALTAGTYTGTLKFRCKIPLQWSDVTTFCMVPNGDPQNRPKLSMYLSNLVDQFPENCLIVDPANSGATASLTGAGSLIASYWSKALDILPTGVNPADPTVGLGLTINAFDQSIQNSGQINRIDHREAMLYEKVFHILVTGQQTVEADYFGNWLTGQSKNARQTFDASANSFQDYYTMIGNRYGRQLPKGVYVLDMAGGNNPDMPGRSPYVAQMTPDQDYATNFGIAFTPAMATALRFPSGTTMTEAYIRTYAIGLVEVPY